MKLTLETIRHFLPNIQRPPNPADLYGSDYDSPYYGPTGHDGITSIGVMLLVCFAFWCIYITFFKDQEANDREKREFEEERRWALAPTALGGVYDYGTDDEGNPLDHEGNPVYSPTHDRKGNPLI